MSTFKSSSQSNQSEAWNLLSLEPREPKGVLTDKFIMRFDRYLNWDLLSSHYDFPIEMLRIYPHRVNWAKLLRRIKFSEEFLREMAPHFDECWGILCKYQTLSEKFIHDFAGKIDWNYVLLYQNVTSRFLDEHKMYFDEKQS